MASHEACPREPDIPAFLQGELPTAEQKAFESHLAECPACAAVLYGPELERNLPTIPATAGFQRQAATQADLHRLNLSASWLSASGFFSRGEIVYFAQRLAGAGAPGSGDEFPQLNLYAGYRFPRRRGELTVGVLNLTGEDYQLYPLNYYPEMPREPVFYARVRLNF